MHKLRWDDLHYVLAVAEHGSLSAAGRALGVNHATVLRRITALEERYGVTLFERPPGGYRLKPGSQDVLAGIRTIERTVERLERSLFASGKAIEGACRVTTTDTIAQALLPRHLSTLHRLYPDLQVELIVSNTYIDMERPDAEISIRPALSLTSGLVGQRICDMVFRVYGTRDYLARHEGAEFAGHRWLGVAAPLTRSPVGAWQDKHIGDRFVTRADSFLALSSAAETGLGLAMLPSMIARRSNRLVRAPMFTDELTTGVWVATHPDLTDSELVRFLMEFFGEALATDADLLC